MVYYYHNLVNKENLSTVCSECKKGERGCVACKKELASKLNEFLQDFRDKRKYYDQNPEIVDNILKSGIQKARKMAQDTMLDVKKSMKIDYFE